MKDFSGQTGAQHLFGPGLAGAARHGDDAGLRPQTRARRNSNAPERAQRIIDADQHSNISGRNEVRSHERRSGTALEGGTDELVPVTLIRERDEDLAGRERTRVDGKTRDRVRRRTFGPAFRRRDERVPSPERRVVSHEGAS